MTVPTPLPSSGVAASGGTSTGAPEERANRQPTLQEQTLRDARAAALRALDSASMDPEAAARACDVALSQLIPFGLTEALADALRWAGTIRRDRGLLTEAESLYNHSLSVASAASYEIGRAHALNCLGSLAQLRGNLAQAEERYLEAGTLAAALEDRHLWALIQQNLGIIAGDQGRNEDAAMRFREALTVLDDEHSESAAVVWLLTNLGELHRRDGMPHRALGELERARRLARQLRDLRSEGIVEENLSAVHLALGNLDAAERAAARAVSIANQRHDSLRLAAALRAVAAVYHKQGLSAADVIPTLEKGVALIGSSEDASLLAEVLLDLGDRYSDAGRIENAEAAWQRARSLAQRADLRPLLAAVAARMRTRQRPAFADQLEASA